MVADGSQDVGPDLTVTVSPVTLPRQNQVAGSLLTAFNFSPQSYANKAAELYGVSPESTLPGLFSFLASYRLSPNSWGYGNPRSASGYTSDRRWWLDKTEQMVAAAGQPAQFASMWIPISNNRWSPSTYVGGRSPYKPQDLVLVPQVRARLLAERTTGSARTRTCTEWTSPGRRASGPSSARRR